MRERQKWSERLWRSEFVCKLQELMFIIASMQLKLFCGPIHFFARARILSIFCHEA